jgi:hypothetical protein
LNKIKKDSGFVDSVIAAKALRLGAEEAGGEVVSPAPEVPQEASQVVDETSKRPEVDIEKIISAAEEAAFNGEE